MEENKDLRKKKLEKIYSVGIHKHKGNKHIKSDTYGEITWKGVNQIISCLDLEETKDLVFLDIGSGHGKMVMHMALQTPIKKSIGIELNKNRHKEAVKLKSKVGSFGDCEVQLIKGDILEHEDIIKEAGIIYANIIMFDYETMGKMIKMMNPGTILFVNKSYNFKSDKPRKDIYTIKVDMSWMEDNNHYICELTEDIMDDISFEKKIVKLTQEEVLDKFLNDNEDIKNNILATVFKEMNEGRLKEEDMEKEIELLTKLAFVKVQEKKENNE